jgi:hypothetical protein
MNTHYDEAVWTMLDPETDWPTLPEDINPERGGPEAHFADCIREHVTHARSQLAQLEAALGRPGWFEVEQEAFDALQEAVVGIEVAVTGRVILAHAAIADGSCA